MTTILTLEVKALLREKAGREGQDIGAVANLILPAALGAEAQERAETFEGDSLGIGDFVAGY